MLDPLVERDPRMRPRVVVFDECHELFEHKTYGPEAAELAVKVLKKARKVGITLLFATVSPTAAGIPEDVTRNTSHRVAFAVGDHVANDGLLGIGKHRAGITATTLNPAENIGTALTVGFTPNAFELVRAYYVRKGAGTGQVTPVVQRALALREGITPAATITARADDGVDPLADILTVLGTAESDGRMVVDRERVRDAVADRQDDPAAGGYGGLDMAVRSVFGGELAWVADNDPGAARIHHPKLPNLGDITATDWTTVPPVDVASAGRPGSARPAAT